MIKKKPAKKNTRVAKKAGIPTWVAFCCGVIVTLFAQLLFHLAQINTTPATTTEQGKNNKTEIVQEEEHPKPKITFYNELKNMEVKVPDQVSNGIQQVKSQVDDIKQQVENAKDKAQTANDDDMVDSLEAAQKEAAAKKALANKYHSALQTGSFKSINDADEQRAQIMLLGLNADIESSVVNGETMHRVIVGPFANARELDSAKKILQEIKLSALVVNN